VVWDKIGSSRKNSSLITNFLLQNVPGAPAIICSKPVTISLNFIFNSVGMRGKGISERIVDLLSTSQGLYTMSCLCVCMYECACVENKEWKAKNKE
jgi:hypothetical protein